MAEYFHLGTAVTVSEIQKAKIHSRQLNGRRLSYIVNSIVNNLPSRTLQSSAAGLLKVSWKSLNKLRDAVFVNCFDYYYSVV